MLGVDDRLVTPSTMKWIRVGLVAGLAAIPTTILLRSQVRHQLSNTPVEKSRWLSNYCFADRQYPCAGAQIKGTDKLQTNGLARSVPAKFAYNQQDHSY